MCTELRNPTHLTTCATTMAVEACDALMVLIKMSKLDFFIQETPYSSFITIRKKFRKGINHGAGAEVTDKNTKDIQAIVKGLQHENETLRGTIEEKGAQLKASKEECTLLLQKLQKAEKEMINHCEANNKQKAKSAEETFKLKAALKEKSDEIVAHMSNDSNARKTIKTSERNIHNLENKVQNLKDSKSELKNERDKLFNEVKTVRKNSKKPQALLSSGCQTEAEILELCSNNNRNPQLINSTEFSSAFKTISSTVSNASQTHPSPDICQVETLDCVVCNKTYLNAHLLKVHAANEHDLVLNQLKLLDHGEKDHFIRFLKSIELDVKYIEDRKNSHWEHKGERIRFRKLAQIKLAITSNQIKDNMRKNDVKIIRTYERTISNNEI